MIQNIRIDCSPEQLEVIADHLIENKELGMQPDERHWMLAQARKQNPKYRILSANLDVGAGEWVLSVTTEPR